MPPRTKKETAAAKLGEATDGPDPGARQGGLVERAKSVVSKGRSATVRSGKRVMRRVSGRGERCPTHPHTVDCSLEDQYDESMENRCVIEATHCRRPFVAHQRDQYDRSVEGAWKASDRRENVHQYNEWAKSTVRRAARAAAGGVQRAGGRALGYAKDGVKRAGRRALGHAKATRAGPLVEAVQAATVAGIGATKAAAAATKAATAAALHSLRDGSTYKGSHRCTAAHARGIGVCTRSMSRRRTYGAVA